MYASFGARWRARGDHSPLTTPRQPLRSFYIAERAARARAFGCHCSRCSVALYALALRLCIETLLVSAGALHLVSAGTHVSSLPELLLSLLSSLLALCLVFASVLLWSLLPSLLCFRLISPRLRLSLVAWHST